VPLAVLAMLIAGGGSYTTVLAIRHFQEQPATPSKVATGSPTTARATSASPSPSSSPSPSHTPPPLPTQVIMNGIAIGIGAVNTDPGATAVATTLAGYFGGIDAGRYAQAWDTLTSALQEPVSFQQWANGLSTTQDSQVIVQSIQHNADGTIDTGVSFQSHQAGQYGPNPGETCTNWSLDYQLVPGAGAAGSVSLSYLINKVTSIGPGHTSC
jgi:hypothetical protein